jgi:hypothetical protein
VRAARAAERVGAKAPRGERQRGLRLDRPRRAAQDRDLLLQPLDPLDQGGRRPVATPREDGDHQRRQGEEYAQATLRAGSYRSALRPFGGTSLRIERGGNPLRVPIRYDLDASAGRIETACIGEVSVDDVLAHFAELADLALPEPLDVLLDLTPMTSLPETPQIRLVADALGSLAGRVRFGACAVVAKENALFGMSRMFGVYAEQAFDRVSVFRDRDEAERWLAQGGS